MAEANFVACMRLIFAWRLAARAQVWLAGLCTLLAVPCGVAAQTQAAALGTSASGLRGLIYTGLPVSQRELNLSVSVGYGLTEPFAPVPGAHHRAQGSLGAAIAPLPWLSMALRVDGRLEAHPDDYDGAHSAAFGDPRLFARVGQRFGPELALGAELGLWFPGNRAPSFVPSATTVDARALLAFTPEHSPWLLLGAVGFRLDNSASSAPDLNRLRLGDRITLELSSSNAVPLALGVARRIAETAELFAELSADLLIGSAAPPLAQSPLRAALGGRYFLNHNWQAELTATAALSARPGVAATDPLVPIEPRFLLVVALRYGISLDQPAQEPRVGPMPIAPRAAAPTAAVSPQTANVAGVLIDEQGEPLPEATLTLQAGEGVQREVITDAHGRYQFEHVPLGPATLEASAKGCQTQIWNVDVRPGLAPESARTLAAQLGHGVLRGLIRSFRSEPLRAQIIVRDQRGKTAASRESSADGVFEIELPRGRYRVTISAPGYAPHNRSMQIEDNGVSILNVDMREQK